MFPDVSDILLDWQEDIVLIKIAQSIADFEAVNQEEEIDFQGVIQPLSSEKLKMKPIESRSFQWLQIHCLTDVVLKTSDLIKYQNKKFKVIDKVDYSLNGYIEYHVVEIIE